MPTTIDFTKPIRQINGHAANYIGQDRNGHAVIEAQFTDGTWSRACTWSPAEARHCFENIPAEKPKLEGFAPVKLTTHKGNGFAHVVASYASREEALGQAGVLHLSKVPPEAIEWIEP